MKVLITGGAGFIGRKLAAKLLAEGGLTDDAGKAVAIDKVTVFDMALPSPPIANDPRLEAVAGDVADKATIDRLVTPDTGAVFHLAAVVSAGAEQDFDLGMAVNLDGTRHLLEACRRLGTRPKLVLASTCAAYGGDMPEVIEDGTALVPQTSYGTQKVIGELLVNDYSRKGFIDGRALRLPTVVVRPGKPNKAASTFASSIIREPLQGEEAVCPVGPDTAMWVSAPRRIVAAFVHAHNLPAEAWGMARFLALPGITVTVREMVDALRAVAGDAVAARVRFAPDPAIERIVYGWPAHFAPKRALAMGFAEERPMAEIIRDFIDDDLGGRFVA